MLGIQLERERESILISKFVWIFSFVCLCASQRNEGQSSSQLILSVTKKLRSRSSAVGTLLLLVVMFAGVWDK